MKCTTISSPPWPNYTTDPRRWWGRRLTSAGATDRTAIAPPNGRRAFERCSLRVQRFLAGAAWHDNNSNIMVSLYGTSGGEMSVPNDVPRRLVKSRPGRARDGDDNDMVSWRMAIIIIYSCNCEQTKRDCLQVIAPYPLPQPRPPNKSLRSRQRTVRRWRAIKIGDD